jgi:hypothetical protein
MKTKHAKKLSEKTIRNMDNKQPKLEKKKAPVNKAPVKKGRK